MTAKVFIATSLDGYISDRNSKIDWLESTPNPNQIDMGYTNFMAQVDALVMGRNTFETVCSFDMDWPYDKPVFVLSNSLKEIPIAYQGRVELVKGDLKKVVKSIDQRGFKNLYIDGGRTIQSFLQADLINEITITTIPILLGGGTPLFGELKDHLKFKCVNTQVFLDAIVQSKFIRTA